MKSEACFAALTAFVFVAAFSVRGAIVVQEHELSMDVVRYVEPQDYFIETQEEEAPEQRVSYIFPIHPDDFVWDGVGGNVTSAYGERDPSETGGRGDDFHDGLDLWGVSNVGTWHARVVAVADGYILNHWYDHPVLGRYIEIEHDDGRISQYAHLSTSYIHERRYNDRGEVVRWRVQQGDVIGRQGNSGMSKGYLPYKEHLHFGLVIEGENVNPLQYIQIPISESVGTAP